jgi:hypothetical protein
MIPNAIKLILTVSLIANIVLVSAAWHWRDNYESLLVWACDNGNGGSECGEE